VYVVAVAHCSLFLRYQPFLATRPSASYDVRVLLSQSTESSPWPGLPVTAWGSVWSWTRPRSSYDVPVTIALSATGENVCVGRGQATADAAAGAFVPSGAETARWTAGDCGPLPGSLTLASQPTSGLAFASRPTLSPDATRVRANVTAVARHFPVNPRNLSTVALPIRQRFPAEDTPLYAYIAVSLLTGARTEELRALAWDHVDRTAA
jgi:hypothetical protein